MKSQDILKQIIVWYFSTMRSEAERKKVAYISAFTPVEILRAMDIVCFYPESQAVMMIGSGKGRDYISESSKMGYSINLCGYARAHLGAANSKDFTMFPRPDFIVGSNNQCGTIHYWFKRIGIEFGVPVFLLDYPSAEFAASHLNAYIDSQHKSLIKFISDISANEMDNRKLAESINYSKIACEYWQKIHELAKQTPSKIKALELFNYMMPLVIARGTKLAADYYKCLYEEKAISVRAENENLRILWYGYPLWFLKNRLPGSIVADCIVSTYTMWWVLDYGSSEDLTSLIDAYRNTYLNLPIENRLQRLKIMIEEYAIDGVVIHVNRSCKRDVIGVDSIKKMLHKIDTPCAIFEADMMDEKAYVSGSVDNKINIFLDIINQKKPA